ncbi:hypothetical protein HYW43_04410 [Candidatus Daviesbacteria bacterium]|nr:hypothetical protein [Candidatus Daviesbacteria bacterium]
MRKEEVLNFYLTYKLYLFPVVIVLSSLVLIMFVIYPQTSKLISNQKIAGDILSRATTLEVKAQALENYDSADLGLKVNYALSAYPTDKDFATAIGLLQNLTIQSGFNIASLSIGSSSSKKVGSQSYTIKLDIVGSVLAVPALLNNIEHSPRIMRISGVEVNMDRNSKLAAVSLVVNMLFAPSPTNFGSIDSSLPELSVNDQETIQKIAKFGASVTKPSQAVNLSSPRGREDPFE